MVRRARVSAMPAKEWPHRQGGQHCMTPGAMARMSCPCSLCQHGSWCPVPTLCHFASCLFRALLLRENKFCGTLRVPVPFLAADKRPSGEQCCSTGSSVCAFLSASGSRAWSSFYARCALAVVGAGLLRIAVRAWGRKAAGASVAHRTVISV